MTERSTHDMTDERDCALKQRCMIVYVRVVYIMIEVSLSYRIDGQLVDWEFLIVRFLWR